MSSSTRAVREVSVKWDDVLLVCRKCGKKQGGGFGPRGSSRLEKVLEKALRGKGRSKTKVIAVPCLDICPKNAVVVLKGSRQGAAYIVSPGTPEAELLDRLGLAPPSQAPALPDEAALAGDAAG